MMKMTLEMNLQRIITIIEILTLSKTVTIDDLIKQVSASKKTILNDIEDFNLVYSPFKIEIDQNLYWLNSPNNHSISDLFRLILASSPSVDFLWNIFLEPYSLIEYSDFFYRSPSNTRRLIKQYNSVFHRQGLDLKITTKPSLHLEGDEQTIRQLYHHLIIERFGVEIIKHHLGVKHLYDELNQMIHRHLDHVQDQIDGFSITIILFIGAQRQKHGYFKIKEQIYTTQNQTSRVASLLKKNTALASILWKNYHFKLSHDSVADIVTFDSPSIVPLMRLQHDQSYYINDKLGITFSDVRRLVENYFSMINLKVSDIETSTIWLYNTLTTHLPISFYIYDQSYFFRVHIQKKNSHLIDAFFYCCKQTSFLINSLCHNSLLEKLFYFLVMSTPEFSEQLLFVFKQKKVILISSTSALLMHRLKHILEKKYPQLGSVTIYNGSLSQLNSDAFDMYDVIITDSPLFDVNLNKKAIQFNFSNVKDFWSDFETLIT